jgi:energy-converting hydrogenase Eha subunit G
MGMSETTTPHRGSEAERWLALAVRTVHLGGVVALGAALHGAPLARGAGGAVVLASGALLFAQDLRARRVALGELAGAVVLLKLAAVAWAAWANSHALAVFWVLLVLSSLSSHAPKRWRHWAPGRR